MNLLLSFAPFFAFAVLIHLGYVEAALWAGALVAGALLLRDCLVLGRSFKILEVGTLALFAALALYTRATGQAWTIPSVRFVVDAGLLLIVLASLAVGRPFTLQYAREGAPREVWDNPRFLAINRSISLVWATAFAVLVLADAAMVYVPEIPRRLDIIATLLALVGAYKYTARATAQAEGSA
ncbi:hypothetical protein [Methylobacterium sp. R2-1]|uniref:hypothetical protein n=1 Tax=Methylobacterium sp. R2-1 TaxID=2587064 RepID=UPI00160C341B|nr:hypothetical protein [Methylobacterium sp. R2-1]MBB2963382.1 signal transduction histidine kinase [Methylobacterium sp. R2-1]